MKNINRSNIMILRKLRIGVDHLHMIYNFINKYINLCNTKFPSIVFPNSRYIYQQNQMSQGALACSRFSIYFPFSRDYTRWISIVSYVRLNQLIRNIYVCISIQLIYIQHCVCIVYKQQYFPSDKLHYICPVYKLHYICPV